MRMRVAFAIALVAASAAAADQLGSIAFPNSGNAAAQEPFLRGVLLLHNFAYPQAASAFIEAERADPNFALAYWGEAMTYNHPIWYEVDVDAGRNALAKLTTNPSSAREQAYLAAARTLYSNTDKASRDLAYSAAMERIARANPDDVEAQTFWALSILGTRARDEVDPRKSIRAAAILEGIYPAHPDHPGILHYLIHAYDDPVHAPLGLRAARRYATVASAAPHALHMPSHIFVQLGMWDDAARSNEAAYLLSKEWVARENASSDKRDLHSLEWLEYVYLQQRRFDDAKRLLAEVAAKPGEGEREHHARDNMQARYAIETGDFSMIDFVDPHAPIQFLAGLRAAGQKDYDGAQRAIGYLAAANRDLHSMTRRSAEVMKHEVLASVYAAKGEMKEAFRIAEIAVEAEAALGIPSGPPETFKPANEFYGELLLKAGRKADAAEQFRASLLRTPNRAASLAGLARAEGR